MICRSNAWLKRLILPSSNDILMAGRDSHLLQDKIVFPPAALRPEKKVHFNGFGEIV